MISVHRISTQTTRKFPFTELNSTFHWNWVFCFTLPLSSWWLINIFTELVVLSEIEKSKIARWTEVPSRVFVMCQPYELPMTQCHLLSTFAKQLYCCKRDFDLCMIWPLDCKSPLPPIWWITHVPAYKVTNHNLSYFSANCGLNVRTGNDLERFQYEWFSGH